MMDSAAMPGMRSDERSSTIRPLVGAAVATLLCVGLLTSPINGIVIRHDRPDARRFSPRTGIGSWPA